MDPRALAAKMRVAILSPNDIPGLAAGVLRQLLVGDPSGWSAGCLRLPSGKAIIVINPLHAESRVNATIMEELSHLNLGHAGNALAAQHDGADFRRYKRSEETEAYWVGAAALIPRVVLIRSKQAGESKLKLAGERGVSSALVTFRERVTGIRLS